MLRVGGLPGGRGWKCGREEDRLEVGCKAQVITMTSRSCGGARGGQLQLSWEPREAGTVSRRLECIRGDALEEDGAGSRPRKASVSSKGQRMAEREAIQKEDL